MCDFWFVYLKNSSDNVNETFNFYIDDVDVDDDTDDHMNFVEVLFMLGFFVCINIQPRKMFAYKIQ